MGVSELEFVIAGTVDKVAIDMVVERKCEDLEEVKADPSLESQRYSLFTNEMEADRDSACATILSNHEAKGQH